MSKAKAKKPSPIRVTIINLKGSPEQHALLEKVSKKTGVPITEMGRRGLALWLKEQGVKPPAEWTGE